MPHPIIRSTTKMIAYLFILYNIREDIRQWAKHWITCQASKIHKLTRSPLSAFTLPDDRFCHIHVDKSGRPPIPLMSFPHIFSDTSTEKVVRKLVDSWISIFGVPSTVTTEWESLFLSSLFLQLSHLLSSIHIGTTAYHPAANGLAERFYLQLIPALILTSSRSDW